MTELSLAAELQQNKRQQEYDQVNLFNLSVQSLVLFDNIEVETDSCNKSSNVLRQCYSNEVKSAKELKIYLK